MLARYRGKTICPVCHGTRLKKEAGYVKVGGKSISQLVDLPITNLKEFFRTLELDAHDTANRQTDLNGNYQPHQLPHGCGFGISYTEPSQQLALRR